MIQTRFYCKECKREWLDVRSISNSAPASITGNPNNGQNCNYCGSPEIELVSYDNAPGFDIPREGVRVILPKQETVDVIGRHHIRTDTPVPLMASLETIEKNNKIIEIFKDEVNKLYDEPVFPTEEKGSIYDLTDMD